MTFCDILASLYNDFHVSNVLMSLCITSMAPSLRSENKIIPITVLDLHIKEGIVFLLVVTCTVYVVELVRSRALDKE
jgi:hypothetical protein